MNAVIHAWYGWHDMADLYHCWQQHRQQHPQQALYLLVVADEVSTDDADDETSPPPLRAFRQQVRKALRYRQQQAVYTIVSPLANTTLLLLSEAAATQLAAYGLTPHCWHTPPPAPSTAQIPACKPWLATAPVLPVTEVLVVGAGIAGAASAYALAQRGIRVTVLEQGQKAQAASGNRQGLLYAKISAHQTVQTELLLNGYAYSRQLLEITLPESNAWQACGVLHLNHCAAESRRNQALAAQQMRGELYRAVSAHEASTLAGIPITQDGLWWPHGAWLHPPAWVTALLSHPNITLIESAPVVGMVREHEQWRLDYQQHGVLHHLYGSHVLLCGGADSARLPLLQNWPFQLIRGQTTVATAGTQAAHLRCALSGASYISPPWQNQLCFGASFTPNDGNNDWRLAEQQHNWQALAALNPVLAADLPPAQRDVCSGHAAVRCDSFDHLPVVGPLGDVSAMRVLYAKLALDKNSRLHTPCPWLPGIFVNTAHGSRGLATAPLCGEAVACALLGLPLPWSPRLQQALHPNRLFIRSLSHHLPWPAPASSRA